MMPNDLHGRVMRGLLAQASIDRLSEAGLLVLDQPTDHVQVDSLTPILERFSIRVVRSARKMIAVYAIFFSFEK